MRYFVTGATGFIGGEIARQLRTAGHDVVTIARTPSKAGALAGLGYEPCPLESGLRQTLEHEMGSMNR